GVGEGAGWVSVDSCGTCTSDVGIQVWHLLHRLCAHTVDRRPRLLSDAERVRERESKSACETKKDMKQKCVCVCVCVCVRVCVCLRSEAHTSALHSLVDRL